MFNKAFAALVFTLILGSVSSAFAEIKVEGDVYGGVFDKYLWRGYNLSENSPVAQGGVDLTAHNFTLSYWTSGQFQDDAGNQGGDANETDITLDYALQLGEMVTVNIGNCFYTVDGGNDTNEVYASMTLNTLLEPKLTAYYDWDENKDSRFYTLEIGQGVEVGIATLNVGALASFMEGTDPDKDIETNVPWHAEVSVSADVALTEHISITPSFVYSSPLSDDARLVTDTEMAAGLTVTLNF